MNAGIEKIVAYESYNPSILIFKSKVALDAFLSKYGQLCRDSNISLREAPGYYGTAIQFFVTDYKFDIRFFAVLNSFIELITGKSEKIIIQYYVSDLRWGNSLVDIKDLAQLKVSSPIKIEIHERVSYGYGRDHVYIFHRHQKELEEAKNKKPYSPSTSLDSKVTSIQSDSLKIKISKSSSVFVFMNYMRPRFEFINKETRDSFIAEYSQVCQAYKYIALKVSDRLGIEFIVTDEGKQAKSYGIRIYSALHSFIELITGEKKQIEFEEFYNYERGTLLNSQDICDLAFLKTFSTLIKIDIDEQDLCSSCWHGNTDLENYHIALKTYASLFTSQKDPQKLVRIAPPSSQNVVSAANKEAVNSSLAFAKSPSLSKPVANLGKDSPIVSTAKSVLTIDLKEAISQHQKDYVLSFKK